VKCKSNSTLELRRSKPYLPDLLKRTESVYFEVRKINKDIGYGIFSRKTFEKDDFLLEYKGIYFFDNCNSLSSKSLKIHNCQMKTNIVLENWY